MRAPIYAWSSQASMLIKRPTIRALTTGGRSSSAIWSESLEGWYDHEIKDHYLLDYDGTRSILYRKRRPCAGGAICGKSSCRRAHSWLSNVLLRHPGVLENAWSRCHTRATFSATQGMGVRRHLLRSDRCGRILRRI